MKLNNLKPHLDLGNFKVYNVVEEGFYWVDKESPQAFGPFYSLYDTCTHYAEILKAFKEPNILELVMDDTNEVIEVDFSTRVVKGSKY